MKKTKITELQVCIPFQTEDGSSLEFFPMRYTDHIETKDNGSIVNVQDFGCVCYKDGKQIFALGQQKMKSLINFLETWVH